jgi:hypothetical protein
MVIFDGLSIRRKGARRGNPAARCAYAAKASRTEAIRRLLAEALRKARAALSIAAEDLNASNDE